jgi:hypothetical protein
MQQLPFLPGLILALAVWVLPLAVRLPPARILSGWSSRVPYLSDWAPWIHSIALPYLGLLLGWISARDYGLAGHTLLEWILGAAAAILFGILLGRTSLRFSADRNWGDVRDEARWTLYRAAAWPWVGFLSIAVAAGFLALLAEYARERGFKKENWIGAGGIVFLLRAGGSALLFLLAHNFFLAMLYYLAAFLITKPEVSGRLSRIFPAKK